MTKLRDLKRKVWRRDYSQRDRDQSPTSISQHIPVQEKLLACANHPKSLSIPWDSMLLIEIVRIHYVILVRLPHPSTLTSRWSLTHKLQLMMCTIRRIGERRVVRGRIENRWSKWIVNCKQLKLRQWEQKHIGHRRLAVNHFHQPASGAKKHSDSEYMI